MVEAVNAPAYAPVMLAEKDGFFQKNGLDVKVIPLQAGSTAAAALIGGSAQFDAGVASDVLLADSKGNHLISIAALTNSINLNLEVSKSFADTHGITSGESVSQSLKKLKGAKIGITRPGSITDLALRFMMHSVGYQSKVDYHEVGIGSPASNLSAMKGGAIQATIFDPTFSQLATNHGIGILVAEGSKFPVLQDAAFGAIITTEQYAKAHPAITRKVAASIAEANNYIHDHPTQALAKVEKIYPAISPSIMTRSLPLFHFARNGATTATAWKNAAQIFIQNGVLTSAQAAKVETQFTNQYLPKP